MKLLRLTRAKGIHNWFVTSYIRPTERKCPGMRTIIHDGEIEFYRQED